MATPLETSLRELAEAFTDERTEELTLEELNHREAENVQLSDELTEPLRRLA